MQIVVTNLCAWRCCLCCCCFWYIIAAVFPAVSIPRACGCDTKYPRSTTLVSPASTSGYRPPLRPGAIAILGLQLCRRGVVKDRASQVDPAISGWSLAHVGHPTSQPESQPRLHSVTDQARRLSVNGVLWGRLQPPRSPDGHLPRISFTGILGVSLALHADHVTPPRVVPSMAATPRPLTRAHDLSATECTSQL